jgi:hypothetical protein
MNRKGFELLEQIEEKSEDLKELLKEPLLPNSFRTFVGSYKIGKSLIKRELLQINNQTLDKISLTQLSMYELTEGNDYQGCLNYIFDSQDLLKEFGNYKLQTEHWHELGFIQVGLMDNSSDVLLLGVQEDNKDHIWRHEPSIADKIGAKAGNNIFEFIRNLKESIAGENLTIHHIELNQIYRNISENYWRVRAK